MTNGDNMSSSYHSENVTVKVVVVIFTVHAAEINGQRWLISVRAIECERCDSSRKALIVEVRL